MPNKLEETPNKFLKPGGRDAFMGVRLFEGNDDVLLEEEAPKAMMQLGPTPYWIKEANETLGIPNEDDDEQEGLFGYYDIEHFT
ncbi:uncharacterized protein ColSpa_01607 [Colletotrichum spaethianum]|uniref:Uncharacterized protein n=1 Tax=Colletotrichum spaethianum TaxID=700344 RepID=A0AA37L3Q5_9PEZI|nr:uncharacterized protein ColSpa_01607 [Colletotrichum spaethianum]GKT41426.1 hypothetical protein ColSpa_01607 [Colletotrichum spaethianum]